MSTLRPVFWTIVDVTIIVGVWGRVFPWWAVAALLTLACLISASDTWRDWSAARRVEPA